MRVLYICTGNSYRSPLAEALTRKYHPEFAVESAGVQAVREISGETQEKLSEEDALEFVKPSPDQVSQRALREADKIVCMKPIHSEYIKRNFDVDPGKIDVWDIKDPAHPNRAALDAFAEIEEKVAELYGL